MPGDINGNIMKKLKLKLKYNRGVKGSFKRVTT